MNNLNKVSAISQAALHPSYYFQSLLEEAVKQNLLSAPAVKKVQLESLLLLKEQIRKYTSDESSSVPAETAESLLLSCYFNISLYLKTFDNPDDCIKLLEQTTLDLLHQEGLALAAAKLEHTRKIHTAMNKTLLATDHLAYIDTTSSLENFFKYYNYRFAAQDIPADIDYPLAADGSQYTGIEYIYDYIYKLNMENLFCALFPNEAIHNLLRGYDTQYKDLLFNIFQIVLTNAIGLCLCNSLPEPLDIGPQQQKILQELFYNKSSGQISIILANGSDHLCSLLDITSKPLKKYILQIIPSIAARIENNTKTNTLHLVFLHSETAAGSPGATYTDNQKMDDKNFRKLTAELQQCRYTSDKITLILQEVRSLEDFIDVLDSGCLNDDEYKPLFKAMPSNELNLLRQHAGRLADPSYHTKKVPFPGESPEVCFPEDLKEWHRILCLNSFLDD